MATPSHDRLHLSCWVAAGFMPRPFQYRAGCSQDAGQVLHPVCPTSSPHRRACPLHRLVATSACRHAAHRQPSARISSAQRSLANRAFSTSSRACCRRRILDAAAGRICASVFSRLLRLLLLARSAIVGPHLGWQSAIFSRSCRASFVEFLQRTRPPPPVQLQQLPSSGGSTRVRGRESSATAGREICARTLQALSADLAGKPGEISSGR
jgi:hypothetical protein